MTDIREQLATLLGKQATDIASIRRTSDVPPLISVVDVVAAIAEQTGSNAGHYIERLQISHPEVCNRFTTYKFHGKGQKNTFVTDAQGIVEIIIVLPGRYAASVRQQAAALLVRYLGGDPMLVNEVCRMRGYQEELAARRPDDPQRIFGEAVEIASGSAGTLLAADVAPIVTCIQNSIVQALRHEIQQTHPWDFHKRSSRNRSLVDVGVILEGDALAKLDEDEHVVRVTDFLKDVISPSTWKRHGNKFKNIFAIELKKRKVQACETYEQPLYIARFQGEYRIIYTEADDELMTQVFHKCQRRFHGIATRDQELLQAHRKQRRLEDYFTSIEHGVDDREKQQDNNMETEDINNSDVMFHQLQEEALCAMHALNNAIGRDWQKAEDMVYACDHYLSEACREGLPEKRCDHEAPGGWYSSEVLAYAVRSTPMRRSGRQEFEMRLEPLGRNPESIHRCKGAVVNKANRHWVALRSSLGRIWLYDSLESKPKELSLTTYLEFIAKFPEAFPIVSLTEEEARMPCSSET